MAKEYKLSPERLKELQDELNYLKTVREAEVAELLKEARSFGDLSENSEYDEAKNEQGKLHSRLAELEEKILHLKPLREYGFKETDIDLFAESVLENQQRLVVNSYVPLTKELIQEIYRECY